MRILAMTVVFAAAISTAHGQKSGPTSERMEAGLALFDAGDFESAAILFESLYNDTNSAEALFAWAQSLRLDHKCKKAVPLYRRFIATEPGEARVKAAQVVISLCEDELAAADLDDVKANNGTLEPELVPPAETTPPPVTEPPAAAPDPRPAPTPATETERGADILGIGLLTGSLVALGGGATFVVLAHRDAGDAQDAPNVDAYADLADRAERRQTIGFVLGGFGVALAGAALYRLLLADPGEREAPVSIGPNLALRGVQASFSF